jgi:hypothetical protein
MTGLQARRRAVGRPAVDNFSVDEGIQFEIPVKYAVEK